MGVAYSSLLSLSPCTATIHITGSSLFPYASKANPERVINSIFNHTNNICLANLQKPTKKFGSFSRYSHNSTCLGSKIVPLKCCVKVREMETQERILQKPLIDFYGVDEELVQKMVYDALVWSSLHGLVVGDKSVQRSGKVPGVGLVHAPFALLPMAFPESHWNLACEVAPIFNELIDRVSLDGKFLQDALSRALVMVVVQPEERNMYDQHWLCEALKDRYPFNMQSSLSRLCNTHNVTTIRKTLAEIDKEGEILPDGTLLVGGQEISVVYFRAGYAPTDYPSEAEWRARLLMEQSSAVKCPSISYHLAGTKKIQQELAKPNMLERFLENKEDISKLQKCFAGLWSLEDSDIIRKAIERPELFVMKPQREGGGNNFYGDDVRTNLVRLQKEGTQEDAAYILMQRIFPSVSPTFLVCEGICHKDHAISELGVYGAYLRNKEKVIVNEQCGYLMRTKVSSSNEGGVAAGFAVLDSIYLS
ncbi:hypothetical protein Peur_012477 [Populus x canadensis]